MTTQRIVWFNSLPCRCMVAFVIGSLAGSPLAAQEVAPAKPASAPAKNTSSSDKGSDVDLVLSPFQVIASQDVGYRSVFTTSGTLVNEELANLPSSVSVQNRELIEDLKAANLFEISRYGVGGEFNNSPTGDTQFTYRGITNDWQTRNFFIWYLPMDSFSIERVEIVRGPNALLYGDAQAGGLSNVITKQAFFRDLNRIRLTYGSWDRHRAEVDLNQVIIPYKLALRINAVGQKSKDFRDFRKSDFNGVQLASTYRPFKGTTIRVESEFGDLNRNLGQWIMTDRFSAYNPAVPATSQLNTGVNTGYNPYLSYDGGKTITRYTPGTNNLRSNGSTNLIDQNSPYYNLVPREWQFSGPSGYGNRDYSQYSATIEQSLLKDLYLSASYNRQNNTNEMLRGDLSANELRIDANTVLPSGAVNPNYNQFYVDNRWQSNEYKNKVDDYRVALTYVLKLPFGIQQKLLGFLTRRDDLATANNLEERGLANIGIQVNRRVYLADYKTQDLSWALIPNATRMFGTGTWYKNKNTLESTAAVALGTYWDGRINTMVGYRRDNWDVKRSGLRRVNINGVVEIVGYDEVYAKDQTIADDSLSYGGVYHVLRDFHGLNVSLVANYSESFRPIANQPDLFGRSITPIKGKGKEAGIRLVAFGGKVALTTTVYDIDQINNRVSVAQNVRDEINNMFFRNTDGSLKEGAVSSVGLSAVGDTNTLRSKGIEFELTTNITKDWTLTANYSHNGLSQSDFLPRVRPFYDQAIAEGRPVSQYTNLNSLVGAAIANSGLVSPELADSANLFTKYTIKRGAFNGLSIGGGGNYRSRIYLGYINGLPWYSSDSLVFNGLLGYERKLFGKTFNFSLNVNNLTDETYYVAYSATAAQWSLPREYRFSVGVKF